MSEHIEVAVLGGTGKTGRAVVAALEARGATARPLGREAYADPAAAVAGCGAAYLIAPNLYPDEPELVRDVVAGLRGAGVERVVYHSVAAPYEPSMPHHLGKAEGERIVRASGLAWTLLQPCAYVDNLLPQLRPDGDRLPDELTVPYDVTTPFGMVGLADVGEAAATVLTEPGHVGATYELGGPELVSVADVAAAASVHLGRPVTARRVPAPADVHPWLAAMFAYYDAHGLPTGPGPLRGLLGREPEGVAAVLARA
ncbi:NmrA family NAD(P)-binding protein [Nocardioides panacisoli]|uniref:SDR family oxidoreductase n=1 Tax=Nocardioides panacisoli TaxID=627624 RepID=UPI001C635509|nr:NmrA family NAD(P)-binding protein [Nocardioides panacisoli]QYJ02879.1 NmrA family NAD(P)-binding protein [Nocardioides panacisoli]